MVARTGASSGKPDVTASSCAKCQYRLNTTTGIAIIGAPASWLVHVAVEMWGGNHPVVVSEGGGGLETSAMRITFGATVITVLCFVCYLVYMRYVHHAMVATVDRLYLDLEDISQTKDVHE